ncbi:MAG: DUF2935 domain-containing protein [Chloroflexota bacterium]
MPTPSYQMTALFENRFWLQILGDHARFTLNALAPSETQSIQIALQFVGVFDALLAQARQDLSPEQTVTLSRQAWAQACAMRSFQLGLPARQLTGPAAINMPPTMFGHMINETDEYLRILGFLVAEQLPPVLNSLHYHLLWLDDQRSHAAAIACGLDPAERLTSDEVDEYLRAFSCLYLKSEDLTGLTRTGLTQFAAISLLNCQAYDKTMDFTRLLNDITVKRADKRLLGTIPPLMPDHMSREQCYYMHKLAISGGLQPPACDPTRSRVDS